MPKLASHRNQSIDSHPVNQCACWQHWPFNKLIDADSRLRRIYSLLKFFWLYFSHCRFYVSRSQQNKMMLSRTLEWMEMFFRIFRSSCYFLYKKMLNIQEKISSRCCILLILYFRSKTPPRAEQWLALQELSNNQLKKQRNGFFQEKYNTTKTYHLKHSTKGAKISLFPRARCPKHPTSNTS